MEKNFENRLAFRRVTGKNKVAPFFPDTVYSHVLTYLLMCIYLLFTSGLVGSNGGLLLGS